MLIIINMLNYGIWYIELCKNIRGIWFKYMVKYMIIDKIWNLV